MKEFRLSPAGQKAIRERTMTRLILVFVLAGLVVLSIVYLRNMASAYLGTIMAILIPVYGVLFGFRVYRLIKRQNQLFSTYVVTLSDNLISREASILPTVAIYRREIKSVTQLRNGTLCIRGNDPQAVITVPPEVDDFEELKTALGGFDGKPSSSIGQVWRRLLFLPVLGLYFTIMLVQDKTIDLVCTVVLIPLCVWSFLEVRRNRNIDIRLRRRAWMVFLFVAIVLYMEGLRWRLF